MFATSTDYRTHTMIRLPSTKPTTEAGFRSEIRTNPGNLSTTQHAAAAKSTQEHGLYNNHVCHQHRLHTIIPLPQTKPTQKQACVRNSNESWESPKNARAACTRMHTRAKAPTSPRIDRKIQYAHKHMPYKRRQATLWLCITFLTRHL